MRFVCSECFVCLLTEALSRKMKNLPIVLIEDRHERLIQSRKKLEKASKAGLA